MIVKFYEKPGCINNTKQKKLLKEKGYKIEAFNILEEKWTQEKLMRFFGGYPDLSCVNFSAPRLKSGEIQLINYTEKDLIKEMIKDPYLIKRPLLQIGSEYACGFENELVNKLLEGADVSEMIHCSKGEQAVKCS